MRRRAAVTERTALRVVEDDQDDTPRVRIRDIGTLRIEVEGVESTAGGARPAQILAMLLINANRRVATETLLTGVWGDEIADADKATGVLESHIWRLRKLTEPHRARGRRPTYLVKDVAGYRLVVNTDNADSLRFEQLAQQGDDFLRAQEPIRALQSYDRALGLWRGRPFEEVADFAWAAPAIARLEARHDHVVEQRLDALIHSGASAEALRELEPLVAARPFSERLWGQLMLALYQSGRIKEALSAYLRARKALLDNLGVEPGPELSGLQQRMLDRDPALASKSAGPVRGPRAASSVVNLPTRLSGLVGRRHELDRLEALLQDFPLVTVVGSGGCGKTRLAIELARRTSSRFEGVYFVDLSAVEDPASVATAVVSTIGINPTAVGDALAAAVSYVQDRRVLLVLDNCEHVVQSVRRVAAALLADDSLCRILVTSREPVGVDGERLWNLVPLPVGRAADGAEESRSEAAQLFWSRAGAVDPEFGAGPVDGSLVEQICAAVDGLPLAIELAAARTRSSSLTEINQQIQRGLAGLTREGVPETSHHRTIQSCIEWSARLLSDPERTLHARLSVLPGVFTTAAASAVTGFGDLPPDVVEDLLHRLVHRSLLAVVVPDSPVGPTRYRQLATVRAHADRLLRSRGELDVTVGRRTAWLGNLLGRRPGLEDFDPEDWHSQVRDDFDAVAAVLQHTLVDQPEPFGVRAAAALWYYFFSDRLVEGQRWMRLALALPEGDPADRVVIQLGLASSLAIRDRTDLAVPLVEEALQATGSVDRRLLAEGLMSAAYNAWIRQHAELDFTHPVIAALAAPGDDAALTFYALWLDALHTLPRVGPAAMVATARDLDHRATELGLHWAGRCCGFFGLICALLGDDADAAAEFCRSSTDRALRATGTVDHVTFEARGATAIVVGDLAEGVRLLSRSRSIADRHGNLWPVSPPVVNALLERARSTLSAEAFDAAWRDGRAS
jgi:predicted ATPase/DNA-binding SARP family transcriptional activator